MKIANSIIELIGHTPLLQLNNFAKALNLQGTILAKLESFNPSGSVKDRAAIAMIEAANLSNGATIIEPTSGNTGIGLAMVAASRAMRLIIIMPESMSLERREMIAAYGAQIILTPASQGMQGAVAKAIELQKQIPDSVILNQFENPANPAIHSLTTAQEIISDTDGKFDIFIAGVGTGGTVSGTGRTLKEFNKAIEVIAVEPSASPLLSTGVAGSHKLQGIGANFIPKNYNPSVVDQIAQVSYEEAIEACQTMARTEGILVGISSGAALAVASKIASERNCRIVALLPDGGDRYMSMGIFTSKS